MTDETAGVDVDRRHRLGLIDDEIATRFQGHFALECAIDLLFDAMQIEYRSRARMQLHAWCTGGDEIRDELTQTNQLVGIIDEHSFDAAT